MEGAPKEERAAVRASAALLDQPLRVRCGGGASLPTHPPQVTLSDGRVVVGTLQCADKQGNLVLHDSVEYLPRRGGARRLAWQRL